MNTNINPLIGANVRETLENVSEALEGLIELLPEGVPLEITPEMHAKERITYSPANIAHKLKRVRDRLEDEVVDDLDFRAIKAAVLDLTEKVGMSAPSAISSIDVESDITEGIELALGGLCHLVVCIANDHSGLCRLIDPLLHALEHASSESGGQRALADQALAECAA